MFLINKNILLKITLIILLGFLVMLMLLSFARAEEEQFLNPEDDYQQDLDKSSYNFHRAKVLEITEEEIVEDQFGSYINQEIKAELISGERKGEQIELTNNSLLDSDQSRLIEEGDLLVLTSFKDSSGEEIFNVDDYDRVNGLVWAIALFLLAILYFGRKRGLGAILGLCFSFLVLIYYIVPNIIEGNSPIATTLIGSVIIASVSLFLAHGINRRSPIIWLSTILTLFISVLISSTFVEVTNLFGENTYGAIELQFGEHSQISLKGILLAGMIIGVLGVLTDVTSTQTALIWELKKANQKYGFKQLYEKSLNVGREHIASLVNTLILIYAGAFLSFFIIVMTTQNTPFWVIITSGPIAEEIIRAIVSSVALILAVPISSILAAYFIGKLEKEKLA